MDTDFTRGSGGNGGSQGGSIRDWSGCNLAAPGDGRTPEVAGFLAWFAGGWFRQAFTLYFGLAPGGYDFLIDRRE